MALADADLVTCGSVLEHVDKGARDNVVIWGSGLLWNAECDASRWDVRAVRGRLTAVKLGVEVPVGDPGMLVSALWRRSRVRHRVGAVPHYRERRTIPWADTVIDVQRPVDEVVEAIGACAAIVSSSLHGCVVANSYGIPSMRLHHEGVTDGDFRWADYATALDQPVICLQEQLVRALDGPL